MAEKTPPRRRQPWTEQDDELLESKYGLISDARLAHRLGRSVSAILARAQKLGLRHGDNYYTALQAGQAFGVDIKTITLWISQGLLKAKKAPHAQASRRRPWQILPTDLEAFVREHPERLDLARMPDGWLRTLLLKQVSATHVSRTARRWTAREDAYLLNNRSQKTQAEMAAFLRRTPEAVHGRLGKLRQDGRMVPYGPDWRTRQQNGTATAPRRWNAEEDDFIRTHWGQPRADNAGKWGTRWTAEEIAGELGRTRMGVESRASRLGLKNPGWHPPAEGQVAA